MSPEELIFTCETLVKVELLAKHSSFLSLPSSSRLINPNDDEPPFHLFL